MKKLLLLLIFIPTFTIGQLKTIKVQLIEYAKDKIPAYCGYQEEWGILKFKVLENFNELKKNEYIFTLLACPRERIEQLGSENLISYHEYLLTIGDKVLPKEINKRAVEIFYKEGNEALTTFWFTNLEKIK